MRRVLRAIEELAPGDRWAAEFHRHWPTYREWFLREGDRARPSYLASRRALQEHMPELLPTYERLVDLAGGGDLAARFLSLYNPTPYLTGCSQAVWTRGTPLLVRNYDYSPRLWDAILLNSAWNGRSVIAMTDCLWGVLDGMNDAGLAVSLSFGGRKAVGDGFGIPVVLRYVLEFCATTAHAVEVLERVPAHMAYNVTVVDESGHFATVYTGPEHRPEVTRRAVATNHQGAVEWHQHATATATVEREIYLEERLEDPAETAQSFTNRFLAPPLFSTRYHHGWGTLYTATYYPQERDTVYRWAHHTLEQSFTAFHQGETLLTFGEDRAHGGLTR